MCAFNDIPHAAACIGQITACSSKAGLFVCGVTC